MLVSKVNMEKRETNQLDMGNNTVSKKAKPFTMQGERTSKKHNASFRLSSLFYQLNLANDQ